MSDVFHALLPAVSVAVTSGERVLLVRRGRAPAKGAYAFPGGRVEPGETLADAARRELGEETGLSVEMIVPLRVFELEGEAGAAGFRLTVFRGTGASGILAAADDAEAAAWFTRAETDTLPMPATVREIIAELLPAR